MKKARKPEPTVNTIGGITMCARTTDAKNELQLRLLRSLPLALGAILLLAGSTLVLGQVIANPNQINGVIGLTSRNPEILEFLTTEGYSWAKITATSVVTPTHPDQFTHTTLTTASDATSTPYEISVESGPSGDGIQHNVAVVLGGEGGKQYVFEKRLSAPVEQEPNPDVVLNFSECVGLVKLRLVNGDKGDAVLGRWRAQAHLIDASGSTELQADREAVPGSAEGWLAVRGGHDYRIDIILAHPSWGDSLVLHQENVTVECDQIVTVVCDVSDKLGSVTGIVDVLGEDEVRVSNMTHVYAFDGPVKYSGDYTLNHDPSSGVFLIEDLLSSYLTAPPRGYLMFCHASFRSGHRFANFRTPFLDGRNERVLVTGGSVTDLGGTFVIDPGYVRGGILLAGSSETTGVSCLRDIFRVSDNDTNGDGFPDNPWVNEGSCLEAVGVDEVASEATMTTAGGWAGAVFEGSFSEPDNAFVGDYELVVGGLNREPGIWTLDTLRLRFRDVETPEVPESYQESSIAVIDATIGSRQVAPGEVYTHDRHYCMSEVRLVFSTSYLFYGTGIRLGTSHGAFAGTDFEGNPVDYVVDVTKAGGTPRSIDTAATDGMLVLCLPQGSYTLTPSLVVVMPSGGVSPVVFPPVLLEVGCRQLISATPFLQLNLDPVPDYVEELTLPISGSVSSTHNVARIWYSINDGEPVEICTDCGIAPLFSPTVILRNGENKLTVTAEDEFGDMASVTEMVTCDAPCPPAMTYDGATLVSTDGASAGLVTLAATLRNEDGSVMAFDDETITFSLTADGLEPIGVTAVSEGGVASVVQALEPAIYEVDVTIGCSELSTSAIVVIYNPEGGFATGAGWILPVEDGVNTHAGVAANFGFSARYKTGDATGHLEFRYRDGHMEVKSSSIEQLVITGGRIVQFKGSAVVNGQAGHAFFVKAIDSGEPRVADEFDIKVWAPGISVEVHPSERARGLLQGGNIVVHAKDK